MYSEEVLGIPGQAGTCNCMASSVNDTIVAVAVLASRTCAEHFFLSARLDQYREKVQPETLIDDLATKCGRPAHDLWTISASSATPEETGSRPAPAGKDRIITDPIGYETGWTIARSLGEVGTTSVHSNPVFACNDCTFLDELHRATLEQKNGRDPVRGALICVWRPRLPWAIVATACQFPR
jgi:hypothetical protein